MKPGIYEDMSNSDYHAAPGWSCSRIKDVEISVSLAEQSQLFSYDSQAFSLGTAVHTLVLERNNFDSQIAVIPSGWNLRTKQGKADKKMFYAENEGKVILTDKEYHQAKTMADNILTIYGSILDGCQSESSVFAHDQDSDLLLKCRPDSLCLNRKTIFDLKTSRDDFSVFGRRTVYQYGYDLQAYTYLKVCSLAGLQVDDFAFIVVQSVKPYRCFGYICTPELLDSGREKFQRLIGKITNKRDNNIDSLFHPLVIAPWREAELVGGM